MGKQSLQNQRYRFLQILRLSFIECKIVSTAICGRIWMFLFAETEKAKVSFTKCIEFAEKTQAKLSLDVKKLIKQIKDELFEIMNPPHDSDSEYSENGYERDEKLKKCAYCNKRNEKLLQCGRCKSVFYCSVDCQRPHW